MKSLTISWTNTLGGEQVAVVAPCGCRLGFPDWLNDQKSCSVDFCGMHLSNFKAQTYIMEEFKALRWVLNPVDHPGVAKE